MRGGGKPATRRRRQTADPSGGERAGGELMWRRASPSGGGKQGRDVRPTRGGGEGQAHDEAAVAEAGPRRAAWAATGEPVTRCCVGGRAEVTRGSPADERASASATSFSSSSPTVSSTPSASWPSLPSAPSPPRPTRSTPRGRSPSRSPPPHHPPRRRRWRLHAFIDRRRQRHALLRPRHRGAGDGVPPAADQAERHGGAVLLVGHDGGEQGCRPDARQLHRGGNDGDVGPGRARGGVPRVPLFPAHVPHLRHVRGHARAAAARQHRGRDVAVRHGGRDGRRAAAPRHVPLLRAAAHDRAR
uniref:Uncharacterized protein n=1 Tax=Arundo donax TaxID=35708 RepID=A0A0A8XYL3_ARUDO